MRFSPDRRAVLAGALAAAAASTPAAAQLLYPVLPLRVAFTSHESYLRRPPAERAHFRLNFFVGLAGRKAEDLRLEIVSRGKRRPLTLGPRGYIFDPPTLEEYRARALLWLQVDLREGGLGINRVIAPAVRPAAELATRDLDLALSQANVWARRASLVGMVGPPMTKIQLGGVQSGHAVDAAGNSTALPSFRGALYYDPSQSPGARRLVLDRSPAALMLMTRRMGGRIGG